ncbi:MAG: hypothetical protein HYY52_05270 [Candidatus Melainabacteria bacterium]|nr:hypothetical protein [Candidatus Melainabacteria bacterium]
MNYQLNENIKPFEIEIDKYRPYYYAGASGDFNPIHIDNDFAKMAGLGGIILQGLCTMAYVYRSAIDNKDPGKIKKIKVRFRNMVRPLDKLTIKGKVSKVENSLATVELLAENQKGEQVITNAFAVLSF